MELKLSNVGIRHDVVAVPVVRLEKRVATDQSKNLPITPLLLMQKLAAALDRHKYVLPWKV